jgi:DNA polymerase-3 subunit gamma/tau
VIIDQAGYQPISLKKKIYVIDEVHMLSGAAFNALLKTIEEPGANVCFILATTELQKVPQTIISRVQVFNFKKIPQDEMVAHLENICKTE